jgi:hypothetical protein
MKTKLAHFFITFALLSFAMVSLGTAHAQNTAFSYQGQLQNKGVPANGSYDLQFALFTTNQFGSAAAPILTSAAVAVNNGLFTTTLDFGEGVFTGTNFWIEISVRTNGNGAFNTLAPRQPITPAPYAITAENLSGVVENNAIQNGVSLATISGGGGNVIQSGANNATIGGGGFNTIQSGADHSTIGGGYSDEIQGGAWESFIGGGQGNFIEPNAVWSAIGGGLNNVIQTNATYSAIFGGLDNTIYATYGFIGSGYLNMIQTGAILSTIGGGEQNVIQTGSDTATIGGGQQNTIQTDSQAATIGGGEANAIWTNALFAVVGGGFNNAAGNESATVSGGNNNIANGRDSTVGGGAQNGASSDQATVAGGFYNGASGHWSGISGGAYNIASGFSAAIGGGESNNVTADFGTVGGGLQNTASGKFSFAAGQQAQALHDGAFVWADSQNSAFSSTSSNQFLIRAGGGMGINTTSPQQALSVVGGMNIDQDGQNTGNVGANALTFGSGSGEGIASQRTSTGSGSQFDLVFYTAFLPRLTILASGLMTTPGSISFTSASSAINCSGTIFSVGNITTSGNVIAHGVTLSSDRNMKENFAPLDTKAILEKVAGLPLTEWNYKTDNKDVEHIGPMAQDFHAAFDLNGADDKHISVVDEGGVALAAIQGLNQKLKDKDVEIQELKQSVDELKKMVQSLAERK